MQGTTLTKSEGRKLRVTAPPRSRTSSCELLLKETESKLRAGLSKAKLQDDGDVSDIVLFLIQKWGRSIILLNNNLIRMDSEEPEHAIGFMTGSLARLQIYRVSKGIRNMCSHTISIKVLTVKAFGGAIW